ncbi:sarcosine oxidase subunit delta [Rhizobiaceae bacterium]|nr:sarcosine oxidase subunit delta [Rhizobiaceae bacterium]
MLLIHCPYCNADLPETEFANAGEAHLVRPKDMASMTDHDFEGYFFIRDNPKGVNLERWRHAHGCARFFNAIRDTVSDRFLKVYKAGEPRPSDEEVKALLDAQADGRKDGGAVVGTNDIPELAR